MLGCGGAMRGCGRIMLGCGGVMRGALQACPLVWQGIT